MMCYRDMIERYYDKDTASVVGSGLDRLTRPVTQADVSKALQFYEEHKHELKRRPIGDWRDAIVRILH